jgi:multimeric flavodoxin WrbA
MSKSFRLVEIAREALAAEGAIVDLLDLSRLASEYGRTIHPCKACFSTAPALCHWPCSCYPNYALGQVHDWMNEIYPMWIAAHGIMIVTPVNWYQTSSPLKLMMDRLVCADGGNPDPTRTHGKDASAAKEIELRGWNYPKHLAGRLFAIVVHGDAEGVGEVRSALASWLLDMDLESAGKAAELDRYIGYWKPYAPAMTNWTPKRRCSRKCRSPPARCITPSKPSGQANSRTLRRSNRRRVRSERLRRRDPVFPRETVPAAAYCA